MRMLAGLMPILLLWPLGAEDSFSPIPPSVWAIKEGDKGAVILEHKLCFGFKSMDHVYRVRIYSDQGRAAAELSDLPDGAYDIAGRTVYPDGNQIAFNKRKDFAERQAENGFGKSSRTLIIPPGVTSDCVVEVRWSEHLDGQAQALPQRFSRGLYGHFVLGHAFPVQKQIIEVYKKTVLATTLYHGAAGRPETSEAGGNLRYTFSNLPPLEVPPYCIRPLLRPPTFTIYYQPEILLESGKKGPDAYWKEASKEFYRKSYELRFDKGREFKHFVEMILKDLPTEPVDKAAELLMRIEARIANVSWPTYAEKAAMPKDFWRNFQAKNLEEAVKTRKTNWEGMRLLFYCLLKEAGLKPKIAKVTDRNLAFMNLACMNLWQFDSDLIGVHGPGGQMVWFDPTLRFAAPGLVHPNYTGVPAMTLDPEADWKGVSAPIQVPPGISNARKYVYALQLEEEGDTFRLDASFGGYPEYVERHRFMANAPEEQGRQLKQACESSMKNVKVASAEVKGAMDPKVGVTWTLNGHVEREAGRTREVYPFPGMPMPLSIPDRLPADRKVPIVLPYLSSQVGSSSFKLPKGYQLQGAELFERENSFGKVVWIPQVDPVTGEVKVVFRVDVNRVTAPATEWEGFRQFLGWIQEAHQRQVILAKKG